jgi:hypothetical protein
MSATLICDIPNTRIPANKALGSNAPPMAERGWRMHIPRAAHELGMYPNTYSLVHAAAAPERAAVAVTFANASHRITKSFPFFPSFFLPHTSTTQSLFQTLLKQPSLPKHQLIEHAHSIQIIARDFLELKKIAFALFQQTGYLPQLIEPERQFLLTQKWKYFQSFDEKLNPIPIAFADTQIQGMVEALYPTLKSLHTHNPAMQAEWYEKITSAHELLHPITEKPLTAGEKVERFLDNELFRQQMPLPIEVANPADTSKWNMEQREQKKKEILESPLAGEGKCDCCAPRSPMEAHLLPQSIISTTITQDGVFIHTQHAAISEHYHSTHTGKERREERAHEYGLQTLPLGPLWRNERIELPLAEALHEMKQGNLKITPDFSNATWKCRHGPFALQTIHAQLKERIQFHAQQQNALLQPYMTQFQLYYTQFAKQDPQVQLHGHAEKLLQQLSNDLAWHLVRGETKWRST